MKFKNNKYPNITDKIADDDVKAIINKIIENHDNNPHNHEYKNISQRCTYLSGRYIHNYDEIMKMIKQTAHQECEELQINFKKAESIFDVWGLYIFDNQLCSNYKDCENTIKEYITDLIVKRAEITIKKRSLLRLKKGEFVDFTQCTKCYPFHNNIEFYKDGGWGIANKNGIVLLKNNLEQQPSKLKGCYNINRYLFFDVMRDIDTGLYGVVSLNSYKTYIPFSYDSINRYSSQNIYNSTDDDYWGEVIESTILLIKRHLFFKVSKKNKCGFYNYKFEKILNCVFSSIDFIYAETLVLRVKKNEKFGCYSYKGEKLIECKYDKIDIVNNLIECARDGINMLSDDYWETGIEKYNYCGGAKDLYNTDGKMILGGYIYMTTRYKYMIFLINSGYLIVDDEFKSLLKVNGDFFKIPKGTIYDTPQNKETIPSQYLFYKNVDLSDIDYGFIYLMDYKCDEYLIPDYIMLGFSSHEEINRYTYKYNMYIQEFGLPSMNGTSEKENYLKKEAIRQDLCRQHLYERHILDDKITIIKISKERTILWKAIVNEIGKTKWGYKLYRIGTKCGFYTEDFLYNAEFSAISINGNEKEFYVAKTVHKYDLSECDSLYDNPNYNSNTGNVNLYFKVINNTMIKLKDDWDEFNPMDYNWFPESFKYENDLIEEEEYYYDYYDNYEEEWTDEDGWDAMTDGKYGDYPGTGWDPEAWGF